MQHLIDMGASKVRFGYLYDVRKGTSTSGLVILSSWGIIVIIIIIIKGRLNHTQLEFHG